MNKVRKKNDKTIRVSMKGKRKSVQKKKTKLRKNYQL